MPVPSRPSTGAPLKPRAANFSGTSSSDRARYPRTRIPPASLSAVVRIRVRGCDFRYSLARPMASSARRIASSMPEALLWLPKLSVASSSTTRRNRLPLAARIRRAASVISATVGALGSNMGRPAALSVSSVEA